jgi:hypothetical protein
MYKSIITIEVVKDNAFGGKLENPIIFIDEMLIPFKIGSVLKGFLKAFRSSKLLGIGHRKRGDVGTW